MAKVTQKYNLAAIHPELVKEWHPTKNLPITPSKTSPSSGKKVWWKCKKGHEWQAQVCNRKLGSRCPYCKGLLVSKDNCLNSTHRAVSKQWHFEKNKNLSPRMVTANTFKKVWWKCKKGHEWQAIISRRVNETGCPFCCGQRVSKDNSFATREPKLVQEWHPDKNKGLTPERITYGSGRKVWWKCRKDHVWKASVDNRRKGRGCPFCSNKKVCKDNCLATTHPNLVKEWDYSKNKKLLPEDITYGSEQQIWWKCSRNHSWRASANTRTQGAGCPKCSPQTSRVELRIYTELKYLFEDVDHRKKIYNLECDIYIPSIKTAVEFDGAYWHKSKYKNDRNKNKIFKENGIWLLRVRENGLRKISKHDIICKRNKNDFNLIADILNAIKKNFVLNKSISNKIQSYINGKSLKYEKAYLALLECLPGPLEGKSLADKSANVSAEWHPVRNGNLIPSQISYSSNKIFWWQCNKGHEWQASVGDRYRGNGCPYCSGRKLLKEETLTFLYPKLSKEWHPVKNGKLKPSQVSKRSGKKVWWKCKKGHEWEATPAHRTNGTDCPYCSNRRVSLTNNLQVRNSKLAKEWHPTKNIKLSPSQVVSGSGKKVWWKCKNGHEWQATVVNRCRGRGCPKCYVKKYKKC